MVHVFYNLFMDTFPVILINYISSKNEEDLLYGYLYSFLGHYFVLNACLSLRSDLTFFSRHFELKLNSVSTFYTVDKKGLERG